MELIRAHSPNHYFIAANLFREYAIWLGEDLCFQQFDAELITLKSMYGKSDGAILLMKEDDEWTGCSGIRRKEAQTAELKRMYIRESHRGKGYGHILMNASIEHCKKLGYKKIVLDTLTRLKPALNLYKAHGFKETAAYYANPLPGVIYMEKNI